MKKIAVLGATGLVGETLIKVLEQRNFPVKQLYPFASERSEGRTVVFKDEEFDVISDIDEFIDDVDLVFGCLDAELSREIIPKFNGKAVVIDNSNAFRMNPEVPLVVPEVNPDAINDHKGLIVNPNCSTIQMVVALGPLHRASKIKRIFAATYQSVSGYGRDAVEELEYENEFLGLHEDINDIDDSPFPFAIGNNLIPHIGEFFENGYTREELKMVDETRKILQDDSILVSATCVRVPVYIGHSEAISVEFEKPLSVAEAEEILSSAAGVKLFKDNKYPMPRDVVGKGEVFVGRLRKDTAFENGLAMWVVADNLLKGAALNAVQIAEML